MKLLSKLFAFAAIILSDVMCIVVTYKYVDYLWLIKTQAMSAPASIQFLLMIPFLIGIGICIFLSLLFKKKAANKEKAKEDK